MMEMMNKTRITESLAVVIGPQSVDVLTTEGFQFDVAIRFVKIDETNLDQGNEQPVFTPEYKLETVAKYKEKPIFEDEDDLKNFEKQSKEIRTIFAFAKANKQNWFNTALFEGVLTEKVGV